MFAIFRKRSRKLSADLDALVDQAAALVNRADKHIAETYQVIDTCYEEIDQAQDVITTVLGLPQKLRASVR